MMPVGQSSPPAAAVVFVSVPPGDAALFVGAGKSVQEATRGSDDFA
jgi:hypothetical protein